ncbi:DUF3073 domain-containing protein [Streptomyces oceani]|uniref:DUF3073 domain-containing protein n=1 Tax=Streptomyces oceani TaxID=1075402 RepID=A0A1E7JX99_9ACTN|nr:DUF3073 domain-containing protein [Streptomyces oceani]OEU96302.1 hypothetical protein AN216_21180 [Streptomyces oceani]
MGRGRAKAKQTKVARQLKYNSGGGTDLTRLAEELGASTSNDSVNDKSFDDDELDDDPYAQYADRYDDDEEDDEQSSSDSQSQHRRA